MNNETITGSTDSNGLFRAENPYKECDNWSDEFCSIGVNCSCYMKAEIEKAHPPLFCYNENNQLVKGVEGLEVKGPVWQYRPKGGLTQTSESKWREFQISWERMVGNEYRQVYIAVQPTEKGKSDINNMLKNETILDLEAPYNTDKDTSPLPESQPLEGVKTAEACLAEYNPNNSAYVHIDDAIGAINDFNAQFATDAGGGNKQLLTDCQEMLMNLIALNHVADEVCPCMNDMISRIDDALIAPSTHLSSEMVEEWINVCDGLPVEDSRVYAKKKVSIGKQVVFKDGKFMHRFDSQTKADFVDVEYKNVTYWRYTN